MTPVLRRTTMWIAAAGALLVAVTTLAASDGRVPAWDRVLLERANGLPDGLDFVEVPMQLGALGTLPAVAIALGWFARTWRAPIALAVAEVVAWFGANRLKDVVERARPSALVESVDVRATASGFGFPSTHAAVAAAAATITVLWLAPRWRWVPVVLALTVAFARVFVGVHFPLDVVGGAAIGVVLGTLVDQLPGVRSPR